MSEASTEENVKEEFIKVVNEETQGSTMKNRLFGREKSIHSIIGGGKSADVLLWRDKKMSSSLFAGTTVVWVFLEWLECHFLSLVCIALAFGMLVQYFWSKAPRGLCGPPRRITLPEEIFSNIGSYIGSQLNIYLGLLQDIACGRDLKQFVMVVVGLWGIAVIGTWFNFITLIYIGFIAAHTLPVFYEKYEDQVDGFIFSALGQLQNQYMNLNKNVLSKISKESLKSTKAE